MSSVQDERALGLSGKSNDPLPSEVATVTSAEIDVGNRDENGRDERDGWSRRRRR